MPSVMKLASGYLHKRGGLADRSGKNHGVLAATGAAVPSWRSSVCFLAIWMLQGLIVAVHADVPHSERNALRGAAESKPLNVVFILADDLGWSDTTLYGTTRYYQTPNLERLAQRGMLFTRAYSASPLCSPTRSAIMTGLSPARTGITTPNCHLPQVILTSSTGTNAAASQLSIAPIPVTRLKPEYRTLAETLKAAGYATGHFGKWHLGPEPYSPLQQGFDVDLPHHAGPGPAGSYVAPWKFRDFDPDPETPDQHIEDRMAREATAFMEQHRDEPFFLNYWMFSVHAPFNAKDTLIRKHADRANPEDPQHCPTYAAMVESMDDAVGTILDTIDRLGLAENTIIVFTSDNGGNMYSDVDGTVPTSNAPLRGGKATMYEGGTRVPCIIAWPGVTPAASRSEAIIQSEDFYPTLLDGLRIPPADGQVFDGITVQPALRGEPLRRDAVFQYFPHNPPVPDWIPPSVSVHQDHWKLIRIFHGTPEGDHRYLLFDLQTDIGELSDCSAQQPQRVRQLDALIEAFLERTNAVVPIRNPAFDATRWKPEDEGRPAARNAAGQRAAAATRRETGDAAFLQGWKARGCRAVIEGNVLRITGIAARPFLGVAAGKLSDGPVLHFRIRCSVGDGSVGDGSVEWLPGGAGAAADTIRVAPFSVTTSEWVELSVPVPREGDETGIVRLYLPAQNEPVDVDWIRLSDADGTRAWDF